MKNSTLIRKVHMDCPVCDKVHEVEERKQKASIEIKGDRVEYEERFYYCANAKDEDESEFERGSMIDENLLNARNAYRIKHGLLTSGEIVALREQYGLSQVDLAKLLGWGEATISRYESKAIQDASYDIMLRLVNDSPYQALVFLERNADKFSKQKEKDIRLRILEKLEKYGKEYLTRQAFAAEYADYSEPSESNGFTILNIDKLEATISYIAETVDNLYKVKLMKLLWYIDAISYKKTGKAITGLVYRHDKLGALPVGHYSLMNLEKLNVQEEESVEYDSMLHVLPTEGMDYSVLSKSEKKTIDEVVKHFKDYKTKKLVDYMHEEKAYTETKQGEIISFDLAKEVQEIKNK